MKITMTAISKKHRACFIYTKSKKTAKRFYIEKPDTFQKGRQFPLSFYIQESRHFTLRDFGRKFLS